MKQVTILGSTGSIGVAALDVIASNHRFFKVVALAAGRNMTLLATQIQSFRPKMVSVQSKDEALKLKTLLGHKHKTKILFDVQGTQEVAANPLSDIVLSAISGAAGLVPTLSAISAGKDIALANKETMVIAGQLVKTRAKAKKVRILPVDSEHSAIFQCLSGQKQSELKRIILTASGGPFVRYSRQALKKVTLKEALRHPKWKMGKKITIDSATLMNKGLEVIEAKWLFDLDMDRIDVLIHPQSIVHSFIELVDGSLLAQLGIPDMRIPIALALGYPDRLRNDLPRLDLTKESRLDFFAPDFGKFPCLSLAYEAGRAAGTAPAVLNAANEIAVEAFLQEKIQYGSISLIVEKVLATHDVVANPSLDEILHADAWARVKACELTIKH